MASVPLNLKPVVWIGRTKADLRAFPEEVKDSIGFALYVAQQGGKYADAKPLRGFSGAGVLEIIENHRGDTYRVVYTVRLAGRVYAPRLPEEIEDRSANAESGDQLDQVAPQASRGRTRGMA